MAEIYKSKFPGQEIDERLELIPELQEGVEAAQQAADGKYTKPASGIPMTDLSDEVREAIEEGGGQADWAQTDTTAPDYIKNKPSIPTHVVRFVQQFLSDSERIQARANIGAGTYTKPSGGIPESDLADDVVPDVSDFITNTVNNLVNYYLKSETYSRSEVQQLIAAIQGVSFVSVASLPTPSADTMGGKIYLVPSANPDEQNVKDEFITIQDGNTYTWEQIGSTAVNLSGYVTTQQLNNALAAYTTTEALTTLLAAKQDTISDLSAIRSGAAAGATAYQKPQTGIPASDLAPGVIPTIPTDVVKYSSQSLTDAQKAQARTNIGAAAASALTALETAIAAKYTKPSSGIPETDLEANVRAALALARTSIQSLADYYDKTEIDSLLAAVSSEQYVDVATLPTASASTLGKIYLVGPTDNQYDRYYTSYDGSDYSWVAAGSTEINLSNYATKAELNQLDQKVDDLDENFNKEQITHDDIVAVPNPGDGYVKKDGVTGGSGSYINTGEVPVSPGDTIACCDAEGYYVSSRFVCAKANGVVVVSSGAEYATNYTVPEGVDTVILSTASSNTPLYYRHVSQVDKMTLKPSSIADESVSETKLASSAVTTSKMANSAVATDKIASKAVTKEKLSDELVAEIESDSFPEYFGTIPGENLLNPKNVVVGYWNKGEASTPDQNYRYVKIDISNEPSGVDLWCYGTNGTISMRFCQFYNGDTFVSGVANLGKTEIPSEVDSVYVSIAVSNMPQGSPANVGIFVSESAPTWSPYQEIPIAKWTTRPENGQALARLADIQGETDVLAGKKWVACGDSFTHGDFTDSPTDDYTIETGQYAGQYKVYPFLIGNRNGMTIVNEAIAGSTLTHIEGRNNAFSDARYQQIPADADYITIKLGINDDSSHQNVPIGTISDATNETFYGAWNVVLDYLIQHHPQAKIGIIVTNGSNLAIVDATIAIAKKWGIAYLNEATDEKCSFIFRSNRSDVVSSVKAFRDNYWHVSNESGHLNYHPNAKAHEYESTVIEAWLRTL